MSPLGKSQVLGLVGGFCGAVSRNSLARGDKKSSFVADSKACFLVSRTAKTLTQTTLQRANIDWNIERFAQSKLDEREGAAFVRWLKKHASLIQLDPELPEFQWERP